MRKRSTDRRQRRRFVRVQDLLGRPVRTLDGQVVGRIEEVRAERRGDDHELIEYWLGTGALLARLALTPRLFGRRHPRLIARWDQLDIREPSRPTLTCPVEELKKIP